TKHRTFDRVRRARCSAMLRAPRAADRGGEAYDKETWKASMHSDIDDIVRSEVGAEAPGVALAIAREGQVLYQAGYGMADLEWRQPVRTDTVLGLGSTTKPFTATAVVLLAQADRLRLDEPVRAYLPDYHGPGAAVTLRHLLSHTSGIPNYVTLP